MKICDGKTYAEGGEGDGIKLLYPKSPLSVSRVRAGYSPTILGGPITGVIVKSDNMEYENLTIRKLTERECMRLQGYTDGEIDNLMLAVDDRGRRKFPKTTVYKFAGNAVTVDVFAALTKTIIEDMIR